MCHMDSERITAEKRMAGVAAADMVKNGMIVGLGTGSTVYYAIQKIGQRVKEGLRITAVSTSSATSKLAQELGISIVPLNEVDEIDITIDGADEVDPQFRGIKGGGGALLFEKIVASCSKQNIWVIDSTKYVNKLGKFLLPVEVIPMGYAHIMRQLQEEGYSCKLRKSGVNNYYTDSGNVILDLDISKVLEYEELNQRLLSIPGVVETGLFLNIADKIILPEEGGVKVLAKPLV